MASDAAAAVPDRDNPAKLNHASLGDTLGVIFDVIVPTIAKGVIIRRPSVVALAETFDLDGRAARRMQRLRAKYGDAPLLLRLPGRSQALILSVRDVARVLSGTPEPFATASAEKRAALAHFEPKNALISHGTERKARRQFNEQALDTPCLVHGMMDDLLRGIEEEAQGLLAEARRTKTLNWDMFIIAWSRMVRRVILGDGARDDHELTDVLASLRSAANWAFLAPKRKRLRDQFHARLDSHLARAEPGSLAERIETLSGTRKISPSHQVAQWLFAFEPGAMAAFRALALLATHPASAKKARQEAVLSAATPGAHSMSYLRACLLESLRLWPTTPTILRETTQETQWGDAIMPPGTSILIYAPFFHRDDNLDVAHRFAPEQWLHTGSEAEWRYVPFSGGPAICPAHNFVPLVASAFLAALLGDGTHLRLTGAQRLDPTKPLPAALNNYSLRFVFG